MPDPGESRRPPHGARASAALATGSPGPGAAARSPRSFWLPLALVLVATLPIYLPVLRTPFFADDYLFLDQVRARSLWSAIQRPDPLSNFFRPVSRQLYFWAIAGLTHESPLAFHIGNLLAFLGVITLLALLVRRLAGTRAALVAAGFLALHYAADESVRWASGSQEVLAVAGALAAIHLHGTGRRLAAGVALLAATFAKEVVLLTPVIAMLADHAPGEPWRRTARRAWPLFAAVAIWCASYLALPHRRIGQGAEVEFHPIAGSLAVLAHLFQVAPGAEWLPGRFGAWPRVPPPLLGTLCVLAAVAIAWRATASAPPARTRDPGRERHLLRLSLVWIPLALVPVAVVAELWSAYYYLFAMAGLALALGVGLSRAPLWATCAVLTLFAWGSANARALGEWGFRPDPWSPVSHVNRAFIEHGTNTATRYLASLRRAAPRLPSGSTVFFSGLAPNAEFQTADGPLLRWAYRDTSLRSYYLNSFSLATARTGPLYFFTAERDSLTRMTGADLFLRIAFGMIVSDQPQGARDALTLAARQMPGNALVPYWQSWVSWSLGDTALALRQLAAVGWRASAGATAAAGHDREAVLERIAAGDTAGAIARARVEVLAHVLDPGAHGLLADLALHRSPMDGQGAIEAFASRVLAPGDPFVWRRWAAVQASHERYLQALESFDRYTRLGGAVAANDAEAQRWAASIRRLIPKDVVTPEEVGPRP